MADDKPPQAHFMYRRAFFVCAGAVAGLLLASLAFHEWQVPWLAIAALAVTGTAASTDVLVFERSHWTIPKAFTTWLLGFCFLAVIMAGMLLVPYAILVVVSKMFGVWEEIGKVGYPWRLLPYLIGGAFGYLFWFLLDDY